MKRYKLENVDEVCRMLPSDGGRYVLHADAQAAIEAARREGYRAGLERAAEIAAECDRDTKAQFEHVEDMPRYERGVGYGCRMVGRFIRSEAEKVRNG